MAVTNFTFASTVINTLGTYIRNTSISNRKVDPNTSVTYVDSLNNMIYTPKNIYAINSTGIDLEYLFLRNDKDLFNYQNQKKSSQRFYHGTTIFAGGDSTGLLNNATLYEATFVIDGIEYEFSVAGSSLQTYTAILTQIDTLLTGFATSSIITNPGETKSYIQVLLDDFGVIHTTDGVSGGGGLNLFESLNFTIDQPIHNPYNFLPLNNNSQLEKIELRGVNYIVVKSPGGPPTTGLTFYCEEYSA